MNPLTPGREQAREWARRELLAPQYAQARPGWISRLTDWLLDRLRQLDLGDHGTGSVALALLVGVLLVLAVAVARAGVGRRAARLARSSDPMGPLLLSAAEHRARAERAEALGDHRTAVLEWFRALLRGLEERALLDPRPGRTVDEAVREAAGWFPDQAAALIAAGRDVDDVWYGGRPGDATAAARVATVEKAVRQASPTIRPDRSRLGPAVPT